MEKTYPCGLTEAKYNALIKEHGQLKELVIKYFHPDRPIIDMAEYAAMPKKQRIAFDQQYPDQYAHALCKKPDRMIMDMFLDELGRKRYSAYISLFNACAVAKDAALETDEELQAQGGIKLETWAKVYAVELKNA